MPHLSCSTALRAPYDARNVGVSALRDVGARQGWRDTPVVWNRKAAAVLPDRAGGVPCVAKSRRRSWPQANDGGHERSRAPCRPDRARGSIHGGVSSWARLRYLVLSQSQAVPSGTAYS